MLEDDEDEDSDLELEDEDDGELGDEDLDCDGLGDEGGGGGVCGDCEGDFVAQADRSSSTGATTRQAMPRTDAMFMVSLPRSIVAT